MSSAGPPLVRESMLTSNLKGRHPLAHLIHALNQPLTGLQCSMELAVTVLRPADHYIRSLRDGLDLVARIRVLVEAIREVADLQEMSTATSMPILVDELLSEARRDLQPIAETKNVQLRLRVDRHIKIRGPQAVLSSLVFRFLESALALSQENTSLHIVAESRHNDAWLTVSWSPSPLPESSPFSPPELGLVIAQAGWEQMGATWDQNSAGDRETCTVQIPLASSEGLAERAHQGEEQ